jgi:rhodanese-related sulfurtransferase
MDDPNAVRTISRDELKAALDQGAVTLIETLPEPYFRHTHLPGALNLPPDEIEARAPVLLPDKNAAVVLYCASPT